MFCIFALKYKLYPLVAFKNNVFNTTYFSFDNNLLNTDIFRRDQVWFTEKDNIEQTDLYSLDDFVFADGTKVRKDANLEKNYIAGRYGAIPYITNF